MVLAPRLPIALADSFAKAIVLIFFAYNFEDVAGDELIQDAASIGLFVTALIICGGFDTLLGFWGNLEKR